MKMESSRRKWPTSMRLNIIQCRCQPYGHTLHSGSQRPLRSLRLASLLQCPAPSLSTFWQRQNLATEQLLSWTGYFFQRRSRTAPDLVLFCRKLMIWLISFGTTFRFQFSWRRFLISLFSVLWGWQSLSTFFFGFFSFNDKDSYLLTVSTKPSSSSIFNTIAELPLSRRRSLGFSGSSGSQKALLYMFPPTSECMKEFVSSCEGSGERREACGVASPQGETKQPSWGQYQRPVGDIWE